MNGISKPLQTLVAVATLGIQTAAFAAGMAVDGADDGRRVFEQWCAGCHADSPFAPGTIVLKATRGADRAVIEKRRDLPAAYIRTLVRKGYAGMPSFRRTEISAGELDALVAYLATATADASTSGAVSAPR